LSRNLEALTSWNPVGLFRPVMGQLYTDTHLEYVILIAFPQKQGLYESAYVLRYT